MKSPSLHRVFAYGSNMHLEDLRQWLTDHGYPAQGLMESHAALLENYELLWNYHSTSRGGGAANAAQKTNSRVYGVVLLVTPEALEGIDKKEGHPHRYSRAQEPRPCTLLTSSESVQAWVYSVQPAYRTDQPQLPRADYIKLMVAGARAHALPEDYIARLQLLETQSEPLKG